MKVAVASDDRKAISHHFGKAIGFAGFDGGAMKDLADVCIVVPYDATPHVEAFHVVLQHLIAFMLKEKIMNDNG